MHSRAKTRQGQLTTNYATLNRSMAIYWLYKSQHIIPQDAHQAPCLPWLFLTLSAQSFCTALSETQHCRLFLIGVLRYAPDSMVVPHSPGPHSRNKGAPQLLLGSSRGTAQHLSPHQDSRRDPIMLPEHTHTQPRNHLCMLCTGVPGFGQHVQPC